MYLKRIRDILIAVLLAISSQTMIVSVLMYSLASPSLAQSNDSQQSEAEKLLLEGFQNYYTGKILLAADSFERSLAIYKQLKDADEILKLSDELFKIYTFLGRKERIEEIYKDIHKFSGQPESLAEYANLQIDIGKYDDAIKSMKILLKTAQEKGDMTGELFSLNRLGDIYLHLRNYRTAISYFNQAIFIAERPQSSVSITASVEDTASAKKFHLLITLDKLGEAYYQEKNYGKALEVFHQIKMVVEKDFISDLAKNYKDYNESRKAEILIKISRVLIDQRNYEQAILRLQEALKLSNNNFTKQLRSEALAFLGIVYMEIGQIENAEKSLSEAVKVIEVSRKPDIITLRESGKISSLGIGNNIDLENYLLYGSGYIEKLKNFETQNIMSRLLQKVLILQNKYGVALEASEMGRNRLFLEQIRLRQQFVSKSAQSRIQILILERKMAILERKMAILERKIGALEKPRDKIFRESMEYTLEMAKQHVIYITRARRSENFQEYTVKDRQLVQQWEQTDKIFHQKIEGLDKQIAPLYSSRQKITDQQKEISDQKEELEKKILSELPSYAQSSIRFPEMQELQSIAKAQNSTIVEYSISAEHDFGQLHSLRAIFAENISFEGNAKSLFIWVIEPNGKISFRQMDLKSLNLPLPQAAVSNSSRDQSELTHLVSSTRRSIGVASSNPQETGSLSFQPDPSQMNRQLRRLHELLIEPIADHLPSDPNQPVIFIPQDALFFVPFPALRDANGKYLIEQHTILTAPSIQVLDLTRQQKSKLAASSGALVVGNPVMPKGLAPLPNAEAEAKAIATLFNTQPLLGAQATKATVMQKMPQARIIHLATHGLLDNVRGLGSSVALAPSGKDDGFLTAEEILDMKLNADLVVLSACDTGRGRLTGDGVIGLSRSLIAAGVPSVLVSLWSVPDDSTAILMTEFHQNLRQHPNKAQALRKAMLTMVKANRNPIDWAGFTLIGEAE